LSAPARKIGGLVALNIDDRSKMLAALGRPLQPMRSPCTGLAVEDGTVNVTLQTVELLADLFRR